VSHHEEGRFVRASGTVRASGPRARLELHRDLRIGASLPCARRLTNLGMIAALVVDEMQAVHAGRTIHLALSGNLDGEWDAERLSQAIANLLAKALEGDPERPVVLRVAGRGNDVHVMVECGALECAAAVGSERGASAEPAPMIARDIVRAHGGSLHELSSAGRRTRVLAVLPRRAG
jgi:signal transduction histidine kinase